MGVKLAAASGGSIELVPTNTASAFTVTVPATTATMAIDGPAFSAYASATTSLTSSVNTKLLFQTEIFDTNNNFASSRFTPTVAGYYQVNSTVSAFLNIVNTPFFGLLYKNGVQVLWSQAMGSVTAYPTATLATLIYLNGSTDYIEMYGLQSSGSTVTTIAQDVYNSFSAFLARSA